MGTGRPSVLQIGDWVHVDGADHQVVALTGTAVRLRSATGAASVMLASYLLASPDFALVDGAPMPTVEPFGLLDGLPPEVVDRARDWERHLVEVITGLPHGAAPGVTPWPGYDPQHTTVQRRDEVKATELTAAGQPVSTRTVRRLRLRYTEQGLWGLVDQRATRTDNPLGQADSRLVAAIRLFPEIGCRRDPADRSLLLSASVRAWLTAAEFPLAFGGEPVRSSSPGGRSAAGVGRLRAVAEPLGIATAASTAGVSTHAAGRVRGGSRGQARLAQTVDRG